jgi:hypothetical protein
LRYHWTLNLKKNACNQLARNFSSIPRFTRLTQTFNALFSLHYITRNH